ncbi:hypothetical protein BFJ69_g9270 [Fusarium oxysporum]|uniref:Ribosomal protein YmL11, mitochondrial n=1 Tax=Fusarium oxysporum TaxID=5507 RepID=A0A420MZK5_FUSOX|nr:hypothetical protein BFJ69_g9270 [Fusarium oxysporum]
MDAPTTDTKDQAVRKTISSRKYGFTNITGCVALSASIAQRITPLTRAMDNDSSQYFDVAKLFGCGYREWAAVRRELKKALSTVPKPNAIPGTEPVDITPLVQLQVVRTNMLRVALKLVEFYDPEAAAASEKTTRTVRGPVVHDLSEAAYETIKNAEVPEDSSYAQIEPVMVGPLAALVLPAVSPAHLAAALSVLAPVPGKFPAPSRKKNPGFHDPICQSGLAKLLLVGGRVEGKIFDQSGINWVGGIEGGLEGLRGQLVAMLQGVGLGITSTLEGGSRSLWLALEGRKGQLEDETKGDKKDGE